MSHGRWRALAGREAELRAIAEITGTDELRTVVLAGPPGIGRTRLARAALEAAEATERPTRWAAGTKAAAGIPLGALAHLLPSVDPGHGPLALLQAAVAELRDADWARRCVIGIDDAHLLDEMSATLVHQIALTGSAALVLTVRTGEPVPDPVSALWKDGLATRLDLKPLTRADLGAVVDEVLAGPVAARTVEHLWRVTGGNPLFLRELVELGKETNSLRRRGGVWSWDGEVTPTPRLVEIVRVQMGELTPAEQTALELLATAGPVGVELLVARAGDEAVNGLERRGLIRVEHDGRRAVATVAQPLHAEVLRAQMPEGTARRLRRELVEGAAHCDRWDVLRMGSLLLESDEPCANVDLLTRAAERANAQLRHGLAERLATAAVDGGGGIAARLALLEALHWKGRMDDVEQVATAATANVTSDDDRVRLAVLRASALYHGRDRASEAEEVLRNAEVTVRCDAARARLVAARGLLGYLTGRPAEAVECGRIAELAGIGDPLANQCAAAAQAVGLAAAGRTAEAVDAAKAGWSRIEEYETGTETTFARLALAHGELLALGHGGRVEELGERAAELHARCMASAEWAGDAVVALHAGWAALVAGRPRTALRWLTDAGAGLGRSDPSRLLPLCTALLARSHALLGDASTAGRLLADLRNTGPGHRVFEPERLITESWCAAAARHRFEAVQQTMRAASVAARMEMWATEAEALHTAVRLGWADSVVARLRALTDQVDGVLVDRYAEHAAALADGCGDRLDEVAAEFEHVGALLLAADAAAQAASAHAGKGDRRRAAASATKGVELARACECARTPALDQLAPPRLTPREAEVAELAARGMHNKMIAGRLVLSVRTVEAHLANIYTKLGISSRKQLRGALNQRMPTTPPPSIPRPRPPRASLGSGSTVGPGHPPGLY